MNKKENINKLKKSSFFPNEFIEIYEKDYDELIKEKEEKIQALKEDLKNSGQLRNKISDLFDVLSPEQQYFLYSTDF
ncbi:hypothetical protein [Aquimarina megaterium]|uniref:hypothetical protein n=1 Tax=Aquimarina megaterium TaxID=1443666 RepID=UPI000942BE36|nr:hypothetical protein [Aquimarina megaterium]